MFYLLAYLFILFLRTLPQTSPPMRRLRTWHTSTRNWTRPAETTWRWVQATTTNTHTHTHTADRVLYVNYGERDDMGMGPGDYDKHTPTHTGPDRLLYVNYGDGDGSRRLQQTYTHARTGPVALYEPRRETTTWGWVQTTTTWAICCRTSWSPICTPVSGDRASTTTSTVTSH